MPDVDDDVTKVLTEYRAFMLWKAMRLVGYTDAEELVQEACLRVVRSWHTYTPGGNIRAWLARVVRTTYLNQRLHESRQMRTERYYREIEPDDPYEELERPQELSPVLAAAWRSMNPDQQAVIRLVVLEERSYVKAADILGIPLGTLDSRLHRGLVKMRKKMES